jgi:hypothetical protein
MPDVVVPTPRTPDELSEVRKRHRHRTRQGEITKHWGLHDAKIPEPGPGYGIKSKKDEDVASNFRAGQQVGVAEYLASRGEAIYKSTAQEPLGKPYLRGHALPETTQKADFPGFGVKTELGNPAKESIWPRDYCEESTQAKKLYRRTHGSTDPGEMTRRDYVFPEAVTGNPHFRFGTVDRVDSGIRGQGAKNALTMDTGDSRNVVPNTRIVNDTLEHYQQVTNDHLGTSKSWLQGMPKLAPGRRFGKQSTVDATNAGSLIQGIYAMPDPGPDPDLGRCTIVGKRNFITKVPLGVPSIRHDLIAPPTERRSVANSTNFGDDYDARGLIFPGKFQFQGIADIDFQIRRPADELRGILEGAGHALESGEYGSLFEQAASLHGDGEPLASVQALMFAYSERQGGVKF